MPRGDFSQLLMVSDSFLATSASNVVAFASDRNRKCHIICPCVMKSVWQLTSRPVTEGPGARGSWKWPLAMQRQQWLSLCTLLLHVCNILMQTSTPCNFPGSGENSHFFSFPHLCDSLGRGSAASRRL